MLLCPVITYIMKISPTVLKENLRMKGVLYEYHVHLKRSAYNVTCIHIITRIKYGMKEVQNETIQMNKVLKF